MAMKGVWGKSPCCNVYFRVVLPQISSVHPQTHQNAQRGAISPTGYSLAISILIFWGTERGRSDLDHGFNLQPGCTCTGARALERGLGQEPSTVQGKALLSPARGTQPPGDIPVTKKLHQPGWSNASPWEAPGQAHPDPFRDETNFPVC